MNPLSSFSHILHYEKGWDNPNVFQICVLRDIRTERERRQTIGRGLRLCVNQTGDRVPGFEVNTLTVIAGESYEDFAKNLQREIENDTGIRFGIVEPHLFAQIPASSEDNPDGLLGFEKSHVLFQILQDGGFIDEQGRIQDSLRNAIMDNRLELPIEFSEQKEDIIFLLRKHIGKFNINNADDRHSIKLRHALLKSTEFSSLWNRIKHKTTYRVDFDNNGLIDKCARSLADSPQITKPRLQWRKANISIGQTGIEATETFGASTVVLNETDLVMPDILTELQDRTNLTRLSLCKILINSGRLGDFKLNPQKFIELAEQTINRCKEHALVDGIRYNKIGDREYYAQELFETEELIGYFQNIISVRKSVYEKIVYDSDIEARFAEDLEKRTEVKLYAKLPKWFKIPTPLGSYNPDWAILVESTEGHRMYFVVETKGSVQFGDLRLIEEAKIKCGEAHFKALESHHNLPATYLVVSTVSDLILSVVARNSS